MLVLLQSLRHMDEAGQLSAESTLLVVKYFTAEQLQRCIEVSVALPPQDCSRLSCSALWLRVTAEVSLLVNKSAQIVQPDLSFDLDCRRLVLLASKSVGSDDVGIEVQPRVVTLADSLVAVVLAQQQEVRASQYLPTSFY